MERLEKQEGLGCETRIGFWLAWELAKEAEDGGFGMGWVKMDWGLLELVLGIYGKCF